MINIFNMSRSEWMSATQALAHLGVRPQTLYAYASRGRVEVRPDPEAPRRSQYRTADVEMLAARKGRSRKHADVASEAIAWGEPVLASAITAVRVGRLYYRGYDAVQLAEGHSLEVVARLLRAAGDALAETAPRPAPPEVADLRQRLFHALADRAATAPPMLGSSAAACADEAEAVLQIVADAVIGVAVPGEAIHERLARTWGADPRGPSADIIRRMLVLVADHELNASTFAARVTASTGASLAASVLAGLTALSGPRHGGLSVVVQRFAAEARAYGAGAAVRHRLIEGRQLPGFGHALYPEGDIRAKAVLEAIEIPPLFTEIRDTAKDSADAEPNIDFAMVAACSACGFPEEAPFAVFAVARTAGWIAHALEQAQSSQLIRPRARYTGPELAFG